MKHIAKNPEPAAFIHWKASQRPAPSWSAFSGSLARDVVRQSLLEEQGHICCYCGKRIQSADSHVEHLKPRSVYPQLALEYDNLLASCEGENDAKTPNRDRHCGHRKGQWYNTTLMVSPLNANCEEHFRYTLGGEILPTEDPTGASAAQETIRRLGLDSSRLDSARRDAITKLLTRLGQITPATAARLIQGFNTRDAQGRYVPFCAAITYVLKRHCV